MDGSDTQHTAADGKDHLSVAEFEAAFVALSHADRVRLRRIALHFENRGGGEAEELLQEALARALEGRRRCPKKVTVVQFIGGIVSSLSSEASETRKKGLGPVPVGDGAFEAAAHDGPSPEREIASRIDGGVTLAKVQEAIAGDEELELLAEGIYDGMKGKDLEELLGIDTRKLATVQKRLQRKLADLKLERALA